MALAPTESSDGPGVLSEVESSLQDGSDSIGASVLDWVTRPHLRSMNADQVPWHLHPSQDPFICAIDLTDARWVGPSTLVALAAFLDLQSRIGREILFKRPSDMSVANYISRMGLPEILDAMDIRHTLPSVRPDPSLDSRSLVALSRFTNQTEVAQMVDLIDYQSLPLPLSDVMCRTLLETGNNVPEHARVEHGYMAAQVVNGGSTLRLAVADSGIGLRASLARQGALHDTGALRMAVSGVSETADPGRGRGLSSVRKALKEHAGVGFLLSGTAVLSMTPVNDVDSTFLLPYPGTVFDAMLPVVKC